MRYFSNVTFAAKNNGRHLNNNRKYKHCHVNNFNIFLIKMDQAQREKNEQACRTAEEFSKLYYDCADKKRHLMSKYYLDTGILVYNGNGISGKEAIQLFFSELPSTEHTITTLDAQPVHDLAVGGNITLNLLVAGLVRYSDLRPTPFTQDFMITAQEDKWKIVSDCFRLQEDLSK